MNTFATKGGGVQAFLLNTSDFVFINGQRRCSERQIWLFKKVNHLCFCIEHLLWSFMNTNSGVFTKKYIHNRHFPPDLQVVDFFNGQNCLSEHLLWSFMNTKS